MQRVISSGRRSIFTPSAPSTSAAPEREDSARLPCLATGTPAPATMNAAQVETLTEPEPSPPVPTTSTASGGALTRSILLRIAATAPVISSTVSPRTRSAINRPPICDGVASPDIIRSNACAASSSVSAAPLATLAISALRSSIALVPSVRGRPPAGLCVPGGGELEEILQDDVAVIGRDALGMELDTVHRQPRMRDPHDQFVVGLGGQL